MGEEKRKAQKVVKDDVTFSNAKKVKDAFIQKDAHTVKDFAIFDVLIPSIKRTIYDLVTRIMSVSLYGGESKNTNTTGTTYIGYGGVDYSRPYQPVSYGNSSLKPVGGQSKSFISSTGYDYENWVFSSRGDVEAVLNQLTDIIYDYGAVSIVDLYDSVGKTAPYTAENFGWKSMNGCEPKLCQGGWRLSMTKPVPITK